MRRSPSILLGLFALILAASVWSSAAWAVIDVQPRTQMVNASRVATFRATWRVDADAFYFEDSAALICLNYVSALAGCARDSILGRVPARFDTAPRGPRNLLTQFDEVVTVPSSIIEKAMRLTRGDPTNALIFYVRRVFPSTMTTILLNGVAPGQPVYIQINLRLTGGTGNKSLTLTRARLFGVEPGRPQVRYVRITDENREEGEICLEIEYTGNGRLDGWWQVWTRNDPELRQIDRMTEASLNEDQRRNQRRFRQIKRIRVYLNPSGRTKLTLRYSDIPADLRGLILVTPRIEVSRDPRVRIAVAPNAVSQTQRVIEGGAVASFPMPVLPVFPRSPEEQLGPLAIDARLTRIEGDEGGYAVVWDAVHGRPAIVRVTIRNLATGESRDVIAPINTGRALLPRDAIDLGQANGDGLPPGYQVDVALLGLDKRPSPGTSTTSFGGASQ